PNFRAFRERIDIEIQRAARYGERFGILVLDLDRFKDYNDSHGHLAGNDALQRAARVIRMTVRAVDFPARYGGEEFAVIVPMAAESRAPLFVQRTELLDESTPATRELHTRGAKIFGILAALDESERFQSRHHAGHVLF